MRVKYILSCNCNQDSEENEVGAVSVGEFGSIEYNEFNKVMILWYMNTYHDKCLRVEGISRQDYENIASRLFETGKADISNLTAFGLKVYTW